MNLRIARMREESIFLDAARLMCLYVKVNSAALIT